MKLRYFSAVLLMSVSAGAQAQQAPGAPPGNAYCREFTQPIVIGGVHHMGYGTSCMQPDGSWQIQNENVDNNPAQNITPPPNAQPPAVAPGGVPIAYGPPVYAAPTYVVAPPAYYPGPYYAPSGYIGIDIGHDYHHGWRH